MSSGIMRWLDRHFRGVFLAPSVVFIVLMIMFPLLYNTALSFTKWSMSSVDAPRFVGLKNYSDLLLSSRFLYAVARTLLYSGVVLVFEVVLGVALAIYLNRDFLGKSVIKTAVLLPVVMTPVTVGMVWALMFEPTIGLANTVFHFLGLPPQVWLGSSRTALQSLMIIDIWECTPEITLITLAGLYGLSSEPFEAARVDGASPWQILWRITLPMLTPTILVAITLRMIDVLKTFDIVYTTTQGGPGFATENINILGYLQAFQYFQFGTAAATLVMYFILILGATVLLLFIKNRSVLEQ